MRMPFGKHRGAEVNTLPCSYLPWIDDELTVDPPATVSPDNRERWRGERLLLREEAKRILTERRRNGVKIEDPDRPDRPRRAPQYGGRRRG